jgi:phosphate uptake regulator
MVKSEPRRLIKFGNSSHVVSIPKEWMDKNGLKKGDLVFFQEGESNEMILFPKERKLVPNSERKIDIDTTDREIDDIKREITSAYINNFNFLNIRGKDLKQKTNQIKEIILPLTGLEILEQNPKEIIVKDLLDVETVSPRKMIRRIDNTIRAIFEDLRLGMKENKMKNELVEEILSEDKSINKMYFLVLKIIKIGMNNKALMKSFEMGYNELSSAQGITMNLEYIGDDLKRIARFLTKIKLNDRQKMHFDNTCNLIEKSFVDVMTAYHQNQPILAREVLGRKQTVLKEIDKFCESGNNVIMGNIAERLKMVYSSVYNSAKLIIY